jgi:hypothetical protein
VHITCRKILSEHAELMHMYQYLQLTKYYMYHTFETKSYEYIHPPVAIYQAHIHTKYNNQLLRIVAFCYGDPWFKTLLGLLCYG